MPNTLSEKQKKEILNITELDPGLKCQGKVGLFLDNWLICEVLAKRLIMYHKQKKETPNRWNYTQVSSALKYFGIDYDDQKVEPAFKGGSKGKRGNKSARQLRNGYLHSLSENDKTEIETRSKELNVLLTYWQNTLGSLT